ncbi:hypothetical protein H0H81_008817 [Sphagnurus paluster]|uniref:Essential protein Yae1 N-terminal domain-containing protein n=1 Tax=Sphagnurus paluster TaxID=117069 RepID=A0A9P7K604_9AGAR|nr:hypothetical protein H0H81_008817 [Sphagnurus paluster]
MHKVSIYDPSRFYETGYEDGFAHGRIHGLIEGRALGRAKGFEIWEELGFYEGFALTWTSIYQKQGRVDEYVASFHLSTKLLLVSIRPTSRATNHTRRLLELISQFPHVNPSATDDTDIPKLFRQIRSRYKALCSTLGVRPSLRYADRSQDRDESAEATVAELTTQVQEKTVWRVDKGAPRAVTGHSFDF